jgi:hypothetical protein
MRIRTIKPEFFKHDGIAALDPLTRILFIGLWCMADCQGRLEDRPARIKVEVLPYDNFDVEAALASLAEQNFVVRYSADGISLIQVVSFSEHQRITGKEAESTSRFPAPQEVKSGKRRGTTVKQRGNNGETPETTGREGKGRETEGTGNEAAHAASASEQDVVEVPLLLNTPDFKNIWARWIDIRKKSKSRPRTPWPDFFAEQLKWLERLGSAEAATESVSQSIRNGWQGLFEPKENKTNGKPYSIHQRPNDRRLEATDAAIADLEAFRASGVVPYFERPRAESKASG